MKFWVFAFMWFIFVSISSIISFVIAGNYEYKYLIMVILLVLGYPILRLVENANEKEPVMNKAQRTVFGAVAVAIVLMLLFPPFQFRGINEGYGFLFNPPEKHARVDTGMLIVQWAAVIMIGAMAWYALRDRER